MGWEARRESVRKYYTRSRKFRGKVYREYVGCGPQAELEYTADLCHRQERLEAQKKRVIEKAVRVENHILWQSMMAEHCRIEAMTLEKLGFHIHRGQLRSKRFMTTQELTVWQVIREAGNGDPTAVAKVREVLTGPSRSIVLEQAGDLARQCERIAFSALGSDQKGAEIVIREKMSALRLELAPANAIEALIIDRIVQCWLQLHMTEIQAMRLSSPNRTLESRVDSLNRRYMQALRTLATVRRRNVRIVNSLTVEIPVR